MSTSELRRQAAELIEQHGWVQGWEGDCEHGFCISEALREAACQDESTGPEHNQAVWEIGRQAARLRGLPPPSNLFTASSEMIEYNDTPGRTMNEVLEMLSE